MVVVHLHPHSQVPLFCCVIVYWYCTVVLTGVETLTDYRFKYGRNPLLELPLAVNPTGCARTEPKLRNQFLWKRPHTQRTGSSSRPIFVPTATAAGEAACPYSKQFVHSKSSQYKKMKQEWRNNVYLARYRITSRSPVQGNEARVAQWLPYQILYTGCNRRNVRDFGRVFLRSNYTDITQNTYIQS